MEMTLLNQIALAGWVSVGSGLRVYPTIFLLGLFGRIGYLPLPGELTFLESNTVLIVAGAMLVIDLLVDLVPGLDWIWTWIHKYPGIITGALLSAGAMNDSGQAAQFIAAMLGGVITAGTHHAKASTRLVVHSTGIPFLNVPVSVSENGIVVASLFLLRNDPIIFLIILCLFILFLVWLVWVLNRVIHEIKESVTHAGHAAFNTYTLMMGRYSSRAISAANSHGTGVLRRRGSSIAPRK